LLTRFPDRVEADLQEYYRIDLVDLYRGALTVRKAAVLVLNLPRGSRTWEAVGGAGAISAEVDAAWLIEHALYTIAHAQNGGKGKKPEHRAYPTGLHEQQQKVAKAISRAEAFKAKHHTATE
jgi:hypothetical protein